MRSLTQWVLGTFASPVGVFILAILDSTLFFSMPLGIDTAVIVLAARSDTLAWVVPAIAAVGSALGAAITFWMGAKIGDEGLERYVPEKRLTRLRARVKNSGAVAFAIVDLIPPPFPFTLFVLAAGALEVRASLFFITLLVTRLIRFGIEAYLAVKLGRQIVAWLESDVVQHMITGFIVLAFLLTTLSIVRLVRSSRRPSHAAA
jgi:membrane protein DedA with SNARE-associated domain